MTMKFILFSTEDVGILYNKIINIIKCIYPTNQKNWPNVFPYMPLYWANVLAIVPTLGQFSWFVGYYLFIKTLNQTFICIFIGK